MIMIVIRLNGEDEEVFEVEKILGICYSDPKDIKKKKNTRELYLKIIEFQTKV